MALATEKTLAHRSRYTEANTQKQTHSSKHTEANTQKQAYRGSTALHSAPTRCRVYVECLRKGAYTVDAKQQGLYVAATVASNGPKDASQGTIRSAHSSAFNHSCRNEWRYGILFIRTSRTLALHSRCSRFLFSLACLVQ